jgi:hypothetical protein
MKKYRIPRKLKKKIPKGIYCYTGIKMNWKTGIYKIEPCPFLGHIKIRDLILIENNSDNKEIAEEIVEEKEKEEFLNYTVGFCKFLKCEINDQCKSCSLKKDF